jgi:hypothetical protein
VTAVIFSPAALTSRPNCLTWRHSRNESKPRTASPTTAIPTYNTIQKVTLASLEARRAPILTYVPLQAAGKGTYVKITRGY